MQIAKALSRRRIPDRREIEWVIGILITVAAVYLHWVNFRSAGALWRDEAGVVHIATLPTLPEMWSNVGHESCPILFPALLRTWSSLVGGSDPAFRVIGFIVGLLLLGAVWLNGWFFHRSAPLVALSLLALNASVVRWADSLRAYGLASALDASGVGDRLAFRPHTEVEMVACSQPGGGDQRAMLVSKFVSFACRLRRCRCGEAAATRFQKCADRTGHRDPGGGVSPAVYRAIIREAQDWSVLSQIGFLPPLIWTNLSLAIGTDAWLVALDVDRSGGSCDRALREGSHFSGCGGRRR